MGAGARAHSGAENTRPIDSFMIRLTGQRPPLLFTDFGDDRRPLSRCFSASHRHVCGPALYLAADTYTFPHTVQVMTSYFRQDITGTYMGLCTVSFDVFHEQRPPAPPPPPQSATLNGLALWIYLMFLSGKRARGKLWEKERKVTGRIIRFSHSDGPIRFITASSRLPVCARGCISRAILLHSSPPCTAVVNGSLAKASRE